MISWKRLCESEDGDSNDRLIYHKKSHVKTWVKKYCVYKCTSESDDNVTVLIHNYKTVVDQNTEYKERVTCLIYIYKTKTELFLVFAWLGIGIWLQIITF